MQYPRTLLVGIPSTLVWSIAHVVSREERTLILTLTVRSSSVEASQTGKRYFEELLAWFDSAPTFEIATDFFARYVLPPECSGACAYIEDTRALFYVCGDASVHLLRAGSDLPIVMGTSTPQCVKGTLFAADILLVGTKVFFDSFATQLAGALDPQAAAQKLLSQTQTHELSDLCGCVFTFAPITPVIAEEPKEEKLFVPPEQLRPTVAESGRSIPFVKRRRVFVWFSLSPSRRRILKFVIAGILFCAVLFAMQRFVLYRRQMRIQSATAPLQSRYDQIVDTSSSPRIEREQLLSDLLGDIDEASESSRSDPATSSTLFELRKKVQETYTEVSRQTYLEHLNVFYDFRLVTADFVASQVAFDAPGKLAVFLDSNRNRMVSLSLEKKQPQTLSLTEELGSALSLTIVDRKAYVLGSKGIYEVSLPLDTAGKNITPAGSDWREPKMIGSFAENLYVVDREARQIFRYDRSDPAASPSAWLRRKEGIEFESLNSLAIDGDVWLSTTTGKINKLTRGEPAGFALSDILAPPDSSIVVYTQEESELLYILEPRAKRIVVTKKSGEYVFSIVSPDLEAATGLIVDEEGKKIFVLAGSLVYEVGY